MQDLFFNFSSYSLMDMDETLACLILSLHFPQWHWLGQAGLEQR